MICGFNQTMPHSTPNNGLIERRVPLSFYFTFGPVNWPPKSCDLTSLDYFLWGYVKVHVYTDKPASIDALEDNIEAFISEIPAKMSERLNWKIGLSGWTI